MKKYSVIEFWRFIFMLVIVIFHQFGNSAYRPEEITFYFRTGYIYVEFFFMLTGIFTAYHYFKGEQVDFPSTCDDEANQYIYYKFRSMAPYYIGTILTCYFMKWINVGFDSLGDFFESVSQLFHNLFLVTSAAVNSENLRTTGAYPAQIWYLSSMFLMLPLICVSLKSKKSKEFATIYYPILFVIYYGRMGWVERGPWPSDLLRGLFSMGMGVFIYDLAMKIKSARRYRFFERKIFFVLETLMFTLSAVLTFKNYGKGFSVILFMLGLLICFSGISISSDIHCKALDFVGGCSFYLFLVHFVVIYFMNNMSDLFGSLSWNKLMATYLFLSIGFSVLLYLFETKVRKCRS